MTHRSDAEMTDPTPPREGAPQGLPAFTGDAALCVKCGELGAATSYRAAGEHGTRDRRPFSPSPKGERLERECRRCDYTWDEALGADEPEEPTPTRGDILADAFRGIASAVQRAAASTRDDFALAPPAGQPDALVTVTGYAVSVLPFDHSEFPDYALFVELNPHREWVVHDGGAGFDADGRPRVGEPYRHPLPSREEALALARRLAPDMTIGSRTVTDVFRDTVDSLTPRQDAAVCPLETPAGADAGMESPEGAAGAQAGAGDAQADRWSRREQLGVLLSRMQRGVLLDAERPLLQAVVEVELTAAEVAHQELANQQETFEDAWQQQAAENARLRDERDRACDIAVALEQQVAAVVALHVHNADADYCEICADHGDIGWPCATIHALNPQGDQ